MSNLYGGCCRDMSKTKASCNLVLVRANDLNSNPTWIGSHGLDRAISKIRGEIGQKCFAHRCSEFPVFYWTYRSLFIALLKSQVLLF